MNATLVDTAANPQGNSLMDKHDAKSRKKEKEFREWVQSITFVDEGGRPVELPLEPDDSPDPENDRGEE